MKPALPQVFLDVPLAHRALHDIVEGRPENSLAAVRAAMDHGYGLEIDVQMSADAQAIVFHDYGLARLAKGEGPVRQFTRAALAGTILRGSDEGIPGLDEVLQLVDGRVPLLIEIKDQDGEMGPDVGPLEAAVAASLKGYVGPVAVMSFNPHSVMHMTDLIPKIPRGLVTSAYDPADWPLSDAVCDHLRQIPDYDRIGASFISHEAKDLENPRVAELKAAGAQVLCWTIRSPAQETEARRIAQNITFERYLPTIDA